MSLSLFLLSFLVVWGFLLVPLALPTQILVNIPVVRFVFMCVIIPTGYSLIFNMYIYVCLYVLSSIRLNHLYVVL
mgnify:CR=1|jgi:hypothetical protein